MTARLVLGAVDQEDLEVISAHVQDAIVATGHMAFEAERHRFVLLLNRYIWEDKSAKRPGLRVQSGLHFDSVRNVQSRNLKRTPRDSLLNLLSVRFESSQNVEDPSGTIVLTFSDNAAIRLEVECLDAHLRDIGTPWKARVQPSHSEQES